MLIVVPFSLEAISAHHLGQWKKHSVDDLSIYVEVFGIDGAELLRQKKTAYQYKVIR
jgi:hypothetical protein